MSKKTWPSLLNLFLSDPDTCFRFDQISYLLPGFGPVAFGCPCPGIHRNRGGSLSRTRFLWAGWRGRCCARRGSWCPGGARIHRWVCRRDGSLGRTGTDGPPGWWIECGSRRGEMTKTEWDTWFIYPLPNANCALLCPISIYNRGCE